MLLAVPALATAKPINGLVGGAAGINTGGLFTQPRDVAVYTGGTPTVTDDKILVVESLVNRVHRLDGSGNFERLWGKDVIRPGAPGGAGTDFEVCTAALTGAANCKGGEPGSQTGELSEPTGIAVDQATGHVYVMDTGNHRVQEFTLDGTLVRAWGWGVDTGADAFQVCTSTCQAGSPAGTGAQAGQFAPGAINSIAMDPTSSRLFATDGGNQRLMEFELDGSLVRTWGFGVDSGATAFETCTAGSGCQAGITPGTANGQFASGWPRHVAVDDDGVVYASDNDSATDDRIIRFDSDLAAPDALLEALPSSLLVDGETTGLEIESTIGNLLAVRDQSDSLNLIVSSAIQEIANSGSPLSGGPPNPAQADIHTLAVLADDVGGGGTRNLGVDPASGNVYLASPSLFTTSDPSGKFTGCVSPNNVCQGLIVFASGASPLDAALGAASDVGATTASLEGTVDPGGGVARYRFEISSDGENWVDAGDARYVAGSSDTGISAEVTGLEPATLYRVRILISKQTGVATTETAISDEGVFLTDAAPPAVTTLGSARRTDVTVRLRGLVDPQGSATGYRFEYGPAGGSFDHHVPIPDATAGSGSTPQLVIQDVSGLQPETHYQYRIVATNFVDTAVGQTVMFSTRPSAPLPLPPPGRAYELVSPADKVAGVGVGIWYHGPAAGGIAGFPSYDGERFAVQGTFGAVLLDGRFSFVNDVALAERTPKGWVHEPAASRTAHGSQTLVAMPVISAAPDLSLTTWGNTGLKLFAEQEEWIKEAVGGVLYLRDWAGKWEVFGPTAETQGTGVGLMAASAVADDGSSAVASGTMQGLAGSLDPTLDLPPGINAIYLDEVPNGLSDTFPGSGLRSLVNACTAGTEIPARIDVGGGSFEQGSQPCPAASPGRSAALISTRGATLGDDSDGIISSDGSRVFFMSPQPGPGSSSCTGTGSATECPAQVYVRQRNGDGSVATRWISKSEVSDQDASLMSPALFEGASKDGDKVFFRTASPLTADDPNGEGQAAPPGGVTTGTANQDSWDLYMYDMPDAPGANPADGELTRISAGPNGDSDCNSPLVTGTPGASALRYVSDDGSRLYFTCAAPLDGVPLADDGTVTTPEGTPTTSDLTNLYAYDASQPQTQRYRFVARLPRTSPLGGCATVGARRGAALSPANEQVPTLSILDTVSCVHGIGDGSLITFWTDGRLTDDDPDAVSGDIYAYDAERDELTRVSAPRGGLGGTYPCIGNPAGPSCYADDGIGRPGGGMPLPKLGVAEDPVSGTQSVFFESRSRLVPQDIDGAYDVYQWRNGELSLISTGISDTDGALYAGNSRTGQNVYFATRDRLSWQDRDSVLDVYSARVGAGIPQPPSTAETCNPTVDQCQGPGGQPGAHQIDSDSPAAGNRPAGHRLRLSVRELSSKARQRAARIGRLRVTVHVSAPADVALTARARIAGRPKVIATAKRRIARAGSAKVVLHLSKAARKRLAAGKRLAVRISVRSPGTRTAHLRVALERR